MPPREIILRTFAEWTAMSALKRGPVKSGKIIYPLLDFPEVLNSTLGSITEKEFEDWHKRTIKELMRHEHGLKGHFGWTAKLINVYLKTYAYIGDGGRPNLRQVLHPPIDNGLWKGVKRWAVGQQDIEDIIKKTHCVTRIKDICKHEVYCKIIAGLRCVAERLGCTLIEVEQLWTGTDVQ